MKVSVIVPTFNRAFLLPETIDAILSQTFTDFELVIIDNCSEDNTEDVVRNYMENDSRVKYFKHPNYGVVAVNRNFGIDQSQGEYVAFCDDDDLWESNKLELQLQEFQKDPQIGLVSTNARKFNEYKELGDFLIDSDEKYFSFENLVHNNNVVSSSVLVRRDILDDVGHFDETRELFTIEDFDLWLRISLKYKIRFLNDFLLRYRLHSGNASNYLTNKFTFKRFKQYKMIFQKYENSHPDLVKQMLQTYLINLRAQNTLSLLLRNKIRKIDFLRNKRFSLRERIWIILRALAEIGGLREIHTCLKNTKQYQLIVNKIFT